MIKETELYSDWVASLEAMGLLTEDEFRAYVEEYLDWVYQMEVENGHENIAF